MTYQQDSTIFISHYAAEAEVAKALQKVLEGAFVQSKVFLSSDDKSIALGKAFDEKILTAIKDTAIGLYLLSPESMARSWIHFEIGALWALGRSMVPICFCGLSFDQLQGPILGRNGINAADKEGLRKLLVSISESLGARTPARVNWNPFLRAIRQHEEAIRKSHNRQTAHDIALLSKTFSPGEGIALHDAIRRTPSGGGANIPFNRIGLKQKDALERLEQSGCLEVHKRGPRGVTTELGLYGTVKYSELYVTPEFAHMLEMALEEE